MAAAAEAGRDSVDASACVYEENCPSVRRRQQNYIIKTATVCRGSVRRVGYNTGKTVEGTRGGEETTVGGGRVYTWGIVVSLTELSRIFNQVTSCAQCSKTISNGQGRCAHT